MEHSKKVHGRMQNFLNGGGGILLGFHAKGGAALGPMLKSLHRGPKGGGPDPPDPLLKFYTCSEHTLRIYVS